MKKRMLIMVAILVLLAGLLFAAHTWDFVGVIKRMHGG